MTAIPITIIILAFVAMLFVNVYFRVKVFKIYKRLVQNGVIFESKHMFDSKLMEEEILPKYPQHREDILMFVGNIKKSMNIALLLIVLITVVGLTLKATS